MTDPQDKDRKPAAGELPPPVDGPTEDQRSGRVAFDSRGNPIWEWKLETGVYSRDVSTQKLKKLDLGDLSIAESAIQKRPAGLGRDRRTSAAPMPGGGFDPYDNSQPADSSVNPYDNARALANRVKSEAEADIPKPAQPAARKASPPRTSASPAPPRKASILSKLDHWFKGKRHSKDDDYE